MRGLRRFPDVEITLPDGTRAVRSRYAMALYREPERLDIVHRQTPGAPAPRQEWIDEVLLTVWADRQELVRGEVAIVNPTKARVIARNIDRFLGPRGIELLRAAEAERSGTARNDAGSDRRYIAVLAEPFGPAEDEPEYQLPAHLRAQLLAMDDPPRPYDTLVFVTEPARGFRRGESAPYHSVARVRDPSLASVVYEPLAGAIVIDRRIPEPGVPTVLEPDDYARAGIHREPVVVENPFGGPRESTFRLVARPERARAMTRSELLTALRQGLKRMWLPTGVDREVLASQLYTSIAMGRSAPSLRAMRAKYSAARDVFHLATGIKLPANDLGIEEVFRGQPLVALSGDAPTQSPPRRTLAVRVPPRLVSTLRRPVTGGSLFDIVPDQGLVGRLAAAREKREQGTFLFEDRQALIPDVREREDVAFGDVLAFYGEAVAGRGGSVTLHLLALGLVVDESLGRVYFDSEPCDAEVKLSKTAAQEVLAGGEYAPLPPGSAGTVRYLACFPRSFEVPFPSGGAPAQSLPAPDADVPLMALSLRPDDGASRVVPSSTPAQRGRASRHGRE